MAINVLIADQERAFADMPTARLDDEQHIGEQHIEATGAVRVQAPGSSPPAGKSAEVTPLEADLPNDTADRLCRQLSGRGTSARVIMLSFSSEPERIVKALWAQAVAWACKDESLEHLLRVIRAAARRGMPGEGAD